MAPHSKINEFLAQKTLAVAGVSLSPYKYGTIVYKDLIDKGYRVFAINPHLDSFEGQPCYPDPASLPEPVGGLVIVTPPEVTEKLIVQAAQAGIPRIWLQPGAESGATARLCQQHGISLVQNECIMVYQPFSA